jgi:bifunctional DNA primase/polymerase-like protein
MTTYPHIAATTTETRQARMTTDHGSELLGVALAAAARGWHVFPLRPGTKQPALHGYDRCPRTGDCAQKHQGWEQRATTNPARIHTAWGRRAYNVGIACGPSGLVVIDLDTSKPGEHPPQPWTGMVGIGDGQDVFTVPAEQATGDPLPAATYTVATPSGGLHLYYAPLAGVALRNTEGDRGRGLGWKVDTRAHGGYVVAAGSVVAGRTYWALDDRDPIPLPVWLAERLAPADIAAALGLGRDLVKQTCRRVVDDRQLTVQPGGSYYPATRDSSTGGLELSPVSPLSSRGADQQEHRSEPVTPR